MYPALPFVFSLTISAFFSIQLSIRLHVELAPGRGLDALRALVPEAVRRSPAGRNEIGSSLPSASVRIVSRFVFVSSFLPPSLVTTSPTRRPILSAGPPGRMRITRRPPSFTERRLELEPEVSRCSGPRDAPCSAARCPPRMPRWLAPSSASIWLMTFWNSRLDLRVDRQRAVLLLHGVPVDAVHLRVVEALLQAGPHLVEEVPELGAAVDLDRPPRTARARRGPRTSARECR